MFAQVKHFLGISVIIRLIGSERHALHCQIAEALRTSNRCAKSRLSVQTWSLQIGAWPGTPWDTCLRGVDSILSPADARSMINAW